MLDPGQDIERYTVDAILGEGGMAVVYRIRHRELGSEHALKVLTTAARGVRERLIQEGRVQATLRHPNIVEVRDILDVSGCPGLLMELVDGPALDTWLESNRPTPIEAERIFRAIVSAVAHAHARNLVHRDLKPANVLMAPFGDSWIPKVADFGLARILTDDDPGMRRTRSGMAMGTPAYMSPEQIRDAKSSDQRTDIFALGCILYELVTGEGCFRREDIASTFNASLSGEYRPPREIDPGIPEPIVQAIRGCLRTDRNFRLPDCASILAVLDGATLTPAPNETTASPTMVGGYTLSSTIAAASSQDTFSPEVSAPMVRPAPSQGVTLPGVAPAQIAPTPSTLRTAPGERPRRESSSLGRSMESAAVAGSAAMIVLLAAIAGAVLIGGVGWWLWTKPASVVSTDALPAPPPAPDVAVVVQSNSQPAPMVTATTGADSPTRAPTPIAPSVTSSPAPTAPPKPTGSAAPKPPRAHGETTPVVQPEETPAPSPRAAPVPAAVGTVHATGDAAKVWLVSHGHKRRAEGDVPVGTYQIEAEFTPGETTEAGELDVGEGDDITLNCKAAFRRCRR